MTYTLRAVNPDGSQALLPDCDSVQVNVGFSDVGSLTLEYAVNGINASLVQDQLEIAVFDEGDEVPDTRSVLEGGNGQRLAPEGVLYRSWSGRNLWKTLDESLVYASTWPGSAPADGKVSFAAATPGVILGTLFNKAQSLGELTGITRNFTGTTDSAGNAWANNLTIAYDMGITLLQVIQNMTDSGMAEFRMVGRELQAYNPDTLGTDRSVGASPIVLWAGRNVTEAPEQTNSAGLRTVALVKGENGAWTEVSDATAVAQYGRRAMFVSQGGTDDIGTLSVVGQANLDQRKRVRSELTYKYVPGGDQNSAISGGGYGVEPFGEAPYGSPSVQIAPVPMRDFIPGDWLLTDMTGVLQKVRVRQVLIEWGAGEDPIAYTLVLNDKFLERDIALARQVEGITGGATNGGSMPSDAPEEDLVAPAAPTGLAASSDAYVDNQGHTFAQVSALWLAPTTNADGTVLEDLDHYEIKWWYDVGFTGTHWVQASGVSASWSPVNPGEIINIQVYAVDRSGNRSDPSATVQVLTGSDVTPPPVPSAPTLSTPFAGMVRIVWDGLGAFGEALPPDFKWVEVHWSAVDGFTPDATTLHDTIMAGGAISNANGIPYDQPLFVRFIAVDYSDNRSDPSAQSSATPVKIGVDDVGFTAVDIGGGTFHTYIGATDPSTDSGVTLQEGEIWIDTGNANEPKRWNATTSAWESFRDQVEITEGRIAAGAVTAAAIAAGAITAGSAIIANAAISSAQIASLSAGKITAGTLVADITVSSRIKTADSGARSELNSVGYYTYNSANSQIIGIDSNGFRAYNSSGQLMVDISASGSGATIVGTYRTAVFGGRVEITPGATESAVRLYTDGTPAGTVPAGMSITKTPEIYSPYLETLEVSAMNRASRIRIGSSISIIASNYASSIDLGNQTISMDANSVDLGTGTVTAMTLNTSYFTAQWGFTSNAGATINGGNLTVNGSYRLNTDRIEATQSGILRLEPSIRVVSTAVYNNTSTSAANVYVTSAGSLYRSTSSERYKVNIDRTWGESAPLQGIKGLRPATYWDKGDAERLASLLDAPFGPLREGEDEFDPPRQLLGLIAEDVDALGLTDLVAYDAEGRPDAVNYDRVAVALIPWLHNLEGRLTALESPTKEQS